MYLIDYIKKEILEPEFLVINYKSPIFAKSVESNVCAEVFNATRCSDESLEVNLVDKTVVDLNEFFEDEVFSIIDKNFVLKEEDYVKFFNYINSLIEQINRTFPRDTMNYILFGLSINIPEILRNLTDNKDIFLETNQERSKCETMLYKFEVLADRKKDKKLPHEWFKYDFGNINDTLIMTKKFLKLAINATTSNKVKVIDSYLDLSLNLDFSTIRTKDDNRVLNTPFELVKYLHKILSYNSVNIVSVLSNDYLSAIFGTIFDKLNIDDIIYADEEILKMKVSSIKVVTCSIVYPNSNYGNGIRTALEYEGKFFTVKAFETDRIIQIRTILHNF